MKTTNLKTRLIRSLVYTLCWCMAAQPAYAATVTISPTPLATAAGSNVLPNLLFTLDASGSMDWDFLPDYLEYKDGGTQQCMTRSDDSSDCRSGDPIWNAGGANGSNGVAYDQNINYRPALKADNTTVLTAPLAVTAVPVDAYGAQSTSNIDITSAIPDQQYCNANGVCKRNGTADGTATLSSSGVDGQGNTQTAGRFPYRSHVSSSSREAFGLPEMMSQGTFVRSGSTVTVTVQGKHGLATGDFIYVTGTGVTSMDLAAVSVTSTGTSTFTYTSTASGSQNKTGVYRKTKSASFTRVLFLVTVVSTAHGLVTNDIINISTGNAGLDATSKSVTVVTNDTFTYTVGTSGIIGATTGRWVRTGLYNARTGTTAAAMTFRIIPVEYCSDDALTDCVEVIPPAAPPSTHTKPAYVRFCQNQDAAIAPGGIGDTSGTPRCRGKYVGYGATPSFKWARYGWFVRENLVSAAGPFTRVGRSDCASSTSCTYTEEIQNYARWYTYYRTRMQMMKTAAGRAFQPFISTGAANDKLRVGFITINPNYNNVSSSSNQGTVQTSRYLKIDTFRTTHAGNWYTKFYQQVPSQGTPLREALSRAGWIFAGKVNGANGTLTEGIPAADDPVQASCQRNYTILTTDGYWNGNAGKDLSNNAVGTTDSVAGTIDQPYTRISVDRDPTGTFDGAVGQVTRTSTPTTITEENKCVGNVATTFSTSAAASGQTTCGCAIREHRVMVRSFVSTQQVDTSSSGSTTTTSTNATFAAAAAPNGTCSQGTFSESVQAQTIRQSIVCDRRNNNNNPVTFNDGATASCNSCDTSSSGKRYVLIRQTKTQNVVTTTVDTVQTGVQTVATGTATYQWSKDQGANWSNTAPTSNAECTTNNSGNSGPTTANSGSATAGASGAGTALTLQSPNPTAPAVGTATTTIPTVGGYSDTLADVAMYYYRSDLRGGKDTKGNSTGPATSPSTTPASGDVSTNNIKVKEGAKDFATHQHMVTFTLGLADGYMRYTADYETADTGDFKSIKNGSTGCFWASGTCNWPEPVDDSPSALDDLWHAAVNGRGNYYLATNADALSTGLQNTLTQLSTDEAAASASATSSPNVTETENQIYSTTYETNTWAGRVFAQNIDVQTGSPLAAHLWEADIMLLAKVTATTDTRNIYTFAAAGTNKVKAFDWASLDATEKAYFSSLCSVTPAKLSQCTALSGTDQGTINGGQPVVNFLRGQTGNEVTLFRDRTYLTPQQTTQQTVLGDTISAKPAYVRAPTFDYGATGGGDYSAYITAQANRAARVFIGANDGYLHAFDATDGSEAWAYMPRFLMSGTYVLADKTYAATHRYFVDGSPEVGDVYDTAATAWKTILVGGAGGGGRGYYALDVTDPAAPKALWEFCTDSSICPIADTDLGYTFGNAVFGRRAYDGKWVVIVTSGLNNVSPGTGRGYFYVLDAISGAVIHKVDTGVGDTTTPAGLMKIAPFYAGGGKSDPKFQHVYGGDQLGNVWKLDVLDAPVSPAVVSVPPAAPIVTKITTLKDGAGRLQPITTRPIPSVASGNRVLFIGTGRYLGTPDLTDGGAGAPAWQQSYYAFKDKAYSTTVQASVRALGITQPAGLLIQRTLTSISPTERGIANSPVVNMDWATKDGWFVDFNPSFGTPTPVPDSPGEGVNLVDPRLINGTIRVVTNAPAQGGAQCSAGGESFEYEFDYKTGLPISTAQNGAVGRSLGARITVGVAVIQLPSGAIKAISTGADTTKTTSDVNTNPTGTSVRRFSYRVR